jgi:hypothetical protein
MVTYFEPLKVFLPISLGMIVLGLVAAGLNLWRTGSMQEMDLVIFMGGFFCWSFRFNCRPVC